MPIKALSIYLACGSWWYYPHSMQVYSDCVNDALACNGNDQCIGEVLDYYRPPCEKLIP